MKKLINKIGKNHDDQDRKLSGRLISLEEHQDFKLRNSTDGSQIDCCSN